MEPIEFLRNFHNYYLLEDSNRIIKKYPSFDPSDVVFYRLKRVTFEEKAPRKEALENVISSMRIDGFNLIYLILSDGSEVQFYFGVSRDLYETRIKHELSVKAIGDHVLKPSVIGNFRGSIIEEIDNTTRRSIMEAMSQMNEHVVVEGVPGNDEDKEGFQAVDRLVDVMCGDKYGVMVIANAYTADEIFMVQRKLERLYTELSRNVKRSVQNTVNKGISTSVSTTSGTNQSESKGTSNSTQSGTSKGASLAKMNQSQQSDSNRGATSSRSKGDTVTEHTDTNSSTSKQTSSNNTTGSSESRSEQKGENSGESKGVTYDEYNKSIKDWVEYLDTILFPRLDYGKGRGMFSCCSLLFTMGKAELLKLSNTFISLYSGSKGNRVPLRFTRIKKQEPICQALMDFQIPVLADLQISSNEEDYSRAALSQNVEQKECRLGNWYSADELSLIVGLPQKEVHGISLKEEVEFGLNFEKQSENVIELGKLVEAGTVLESTPVRLQRKILNKHTFVTGVTGCGKTTTCQNLLLGSKLPFLVIEPAKTEYRILMKQMKNFIIFTLGNDRLSPFRLNPFEFFRHESITAHVDMVKASIEAAFDMEAAIPQIIESAIYAAYEKKGWNIRENRNTVYEAAGKDPFAPDSNAFPTLSEVIAMTDTVVDKQGFDARLKNDYIGSIKARLQSLTIGAKGQMLDTPRSYDLRKLLKMHVVMEIEDIKSGNEKAFVMGLVMSQMNEAIRAEFMENPQFQHITLIEEAHRLLTKYTPGDSPNKRHGTEVFADMLAEVRKYGECMIIADQIPDKMIPEVLKNTNTKIVHRLFAKDDKEAIGNTMSLTEEQKDYLSLLSVGRAVVFSQDYDKAIQVQINQSTNTTSEEIVTNEEIQNLSWNYLFANIQNCILPGMQFLNVNPKNFLNLYAFHQRILDRFDRVLTKTNGIAVEDVEKLQIFIRKVGIENAARYFAFRYRYCFYEEQLASVEAFLRLIEALEPPADKDNYAKISYPDFYNERVKLKIYRK